MLDKKCKNNVINRVSFSGMGAPPPPQDKEREEKRREREESKSIHYNQKYWWELNLAVGPTSPLQRYFVDLNLKLVVQQKIAILCRLYI